MRAILLAAGQGSRMQELSRGEPKSLLPVKGEPFLLRLVRQLLECDVTDLTVVLGYQRALVEGRLRERFGDRLQIVENERWEEDVNIHSLSLALERDPRSFLVVEADIYLDDRALDLLLDPRDEPRSVWYTRGRFDPSQVGGILDTDAAGRLTDLRIVPRWEERYAAYRKLVGITRVGPAEVARYRELQLAARDRDLRQYYLAP